MARYCYSCFCQLKGDETHCPKCTTAVSDAAMDSRDLPPGSIIAGRYLVGYSIGHGGFGVTYKAIDLFKNRLVCVKEYNLNKCSYRNPDNPAELLPNSGDEEEFEAHRTSFVNEGESLVKMADVPGAVHYIDSISANNTHYLVMELLDGINMLSFVTGKGTGIKNSISPEQAALYLQEILTTLIAVHKKGLLHRDISPDNIFLLKNELVGDPTMKVHRVKLIDFGSARVTSQNEKTGFMKGVYTAPEVLTHDKEGAYTDLYSLGCVLYFMLMGKAPKVPDAGKEMTPPDVACAGPELTAIFQKATRRNSRERYQTAEAMLNDLRRRTSGYTKTLRTAHIKTTTVAKKKQKSKKGLLVALVSLLTLLLFLLIFVVVAAVKPGDDTTLPKTTAALIATDTPVPTQAPTEVPTEVPTETPTDTPTDTPTEAPTETPTEAPTETPTEVPTPTPTPVPTGLVDSFQREYTIFQDQLFFEELSFEGEAYAPRLSIADEDIVSVWMQGAHQLCFDTQGKALGETDVLIDDYSVHIRVVSRPALESDSLVQTAEGYSATILELQDLACEITGLDEALTLYAEGDNTYVTAKVEDARLLISAIQDGEGVVSVYAGGSQSVEQDDQGRIHLYDIRVTVQQSYMLLNSFKAQYTIAVGETLRIPLSFFDAAAFTPAISTEENLAVDILDGNLELFGISGGTSHVSVDGNTFDVCVIDKIQFADVGSQLTMNNEEPATVKLSPMPETGVVTAALIDAQGTASSIPVSDEGVLTLQTETMGDYTLSISLDGIDTPVQSMNQIPVQVGPLLKVEKASFAKEQYLLLNGDSIVIPLVFHGNQAFEPEISVSGSAAAELNENGEVVITGSGTGEGTVQVDGITLTVDVVDAPRLNMEAAAPNENGVFCVTTGTNEQLSLPIIGDGQYLSLTMTDPDGTVHATTKEELETFTPTMSGTYQVSCEMPALDSRQGKLLEIEVNACSALVNTFEEQYTVVAGSQPVAIPLTFIAEEIPVSVSATNAQAWIEDGKLFLQSDVGATSTVSLSDWRSECSFTVAFHPFEGVEANGGTKLFGGETLTIAGDETVTFTATMPNVRWDTDGGILESMNDSHRQVKASYAEQEGSFAVSLVYSIPDEGITFQDGSTETVLCTVNVTVEKPWYMDSTAVSTGNDDAQQIVSDVVRALINTGCLNGSLEANMSRAYEGNGLSERIMAAIAKVKGTTAGFGEKEGLSREDYVLLMSLEQTALEQQKVQEAAGLQTQKENTQEKTEFFILDGAEVNERLYLHDRDGYLVICDLDGNVLETKKDGVSAIGGNGGMALIVDGTGVPALAGIDLQLDTLFEELATDIAQVELAQDSMLFVIGDGVFSLYGDTALNPKKNPDMAIEGGQAFTLRFGDTIAQAVLVANKQAASGITATASGGTALAFAQEDGGIYVKMTGKDGVLAGLLGKGAYNGGPDKTANRLFAKVKSKPELSESHTPIALAVSDDALIVVEADGTAEVLGRISSTDTEKKKQKFQAIRTAGGQPITGVCSAILHDGYALLCLSDGTIWRVEGSETIASPVSGVQGVQMMRRLDDQRTLLVDANGQIGLLLRGTMTTDGFINIRK